MIDVTRLWSPAGDERVVRAAAGTWRGLAVRIECTTIDLVAAADLVVAANEGRSVDAFVAYWDGLVGPGLSRLRDLAEACRAIARLLDDYAEELGRVRRELAELAAEVALTLAVGAAVTWATAGVSAAAAGATVTTLTLQAAALGTTLASRASAIAQLVGIHASIGALEGMATYAVVEPVMAARFRDNDDPLGALTLEGFTRAAITGALMPGWKAPPLGEVSRTGPVLPFWRDLAQTGRTLLGTARDVTREAAVIELEGRYLDGAATACPDPATTAGPAGPATARAGR